MLVPLRLRVTEWYESNQRQDLDIEGDLDLLNRLIEIIADGEDTTRFESTQTIEASPWPRD